MNNRLNQRHLLLTDVRGICKDQRQSIVKQLEDIDMIYYLNKVISKSKDENKEGDVSPYFRGILEAIYIRTKKQSIHEFIGIVTNIKMSKNSNIQKMYISNVFWNTVYVSHHIVIDHDKKYLFNMKKGDFIRFESIIEEYEDGSNYGLRDFNLKDRYNIITWLGNVKDKYKNVPENYKLAISELRQAICMKDYTSKFRIYQWLVRDSYNYLSYSVNIPYNYYNTMIISLYFRQQNEKILYDRIIELVPKECCIDDLILIHLFVKWMVDERKMDNPSWVFLCTVKFIMEVTSSSLTTIAKDHSLSVSNMNYVESTIFPQFLKQNDNVINWYFKAGNLKDFNDFYKNHKILNIG